jgi:hypothetical protein
MISVVGDIQPEDLVIHNLPLKYKYADSAKQEWKHYTNRDGDWRSAVVIPCDLLFSGALVCSRLGYWASFNFTELVAAFNEISDCRGFGDYIINQALTCLESELFIIKINGDMDLDERGHQRIWEFSNRGIQFLKDVVDGAEL